MERAKHAEVTERTIRDAETRIHEEAAFRQSATAQLEGALRSQEEIRKRVYWLADRAGKSLSYVSSAVLILALIGGALLSGTYAKPLASGHLWISIPAAALVWVALLWGLLNWVWGLSVKELQSRIWAALRSKLYRLLCTAFSINPDAS